MHCAPFVNTCTPGWMVAVLAGAQVGAANAEEAVAISTAAVAAIVAAMIRSFNFPAFPRLATELGSRGVSTQSPVCAKPGRRLQERRPALDQVLVDLVLDRLAHLLRELEHERAVLRGLRPEARSLDRLAGLH